MNTLPPRQPWRTSFSLPAPPSCPFCGEPLHPTNWHVRLGAAWCERCQWQPEDEIQLIRSYMTRGEAAGLIRMAHGIAFYIPWGTLFHGLPVWYPAHGTTRVKRDDLVPPNPLPQKD